MEINAWRQQSCLTMKETEKQESEEEREKGRERRDRGDGGWCRGKMDGWIKEIDVAEQKLDQLSERFYDNQPITHPSMDAAGQLITGGWTLRPWKKYTWFCNHVLSIIAIHHHQAWFF